MLKFFQKLGKSLMLPVCVLPVCGILMGLGYMLCPSAIQGGEVSGTIQVIGYFLVKAGSAAIDNMSILFVIGVAVGMSEDGHGSAVLSGIVSWLVITTLLSANTLSTVFKDLQPGTEAYLAFSKIQNPTVGMIAGLIGAGCYNRFKDTKLPDFLAFFSGRRSVSIVTMVASLLAAAILGVIWPFCFKGMVGFGKWIAALGGIGAGIYAFLNRLLIPTGMHHALNNVFWFDTIGLGDLTNFWKGKTSADVGWSLGMYMSGFFPCMIGGVPGAALAIYHCAKDKKKALGVLASTALCAVFCGLTEPFEFSFMFQCFPLYILYSVLYGLFSVLTYFVGFRAGFSFSAGIVDLVFSSSLPAAQNTWVILPLSVAAFAVYYLSFRFMIKKFDLATIGREKAASDAGDAQTGKISGLPEDEQELAKARGILKAVGGRNNVVSSDCCATRLRLELKDCSLVDEALAVSFGAIGVVKPSETDCQIIIGTTVQQMLEAFRQVMNEVPENIPEEKTAAEKAGKAAVRTEPAGPVVRRGETIRIRLQDETKGQPLTGSYEAPEEEPKEQRSSAALPLQTEEDGSVSFTYVIRDPSGIHARPAGQLAQAVKDCGAEVTVEAGGKTASAASTVQLMGLGVTQGTEIRVKIKGTPDCCKAAAAKLGSFISSHL